MLTFLDFLKEGQAPYQMRQMKRQANTIVRQGLGVSRDPDTIMVKRKDNPNAKPRRISKDRFDPSKYIKV